MTEKLYYADAYLRKFTGTVVSCTQEKGGFAVTLDRTAFYPEGGGQPGDIGVLGGARVLDTKERAGEVVHLCASPLALGAEVAGELDWARRVDLMQQHSGEHIVSGLICDSFGCDNVGFHLGGEVVVIDFNAVLTAENLSDIEARANEVIWENRPFRVFVPDAEELKTLSYRSKKELDGPVRIVECPGADRCACCGTHVKSSGELGIIKLLSLKPFRGGTRVEMLAGRRAYAWTRDMAEQNKRISALLSAKPPETAAAVARLQAELAEARYRLVGVQNRAFAALAEKLAGAGDALLFEEGLDADALRRCCAAVALRCGGRCAVFSGADETGWQYALGAAEGVDLRAQVKEMNAALSGRGGGKDANFAQGAVKAARAEIEAYFKKSGSFLPA